LSPSNVPDALGVLGAAERTVEALIGGGAAEVPARPARTACRPARRLALASVASSASGAAVAIAATRSGGLLVERGDARVPARTVGWQRCRAVDGLPTGEQLGALGNRALDLPVELVAQVAAGHRSDASVMSSARSMDRA
jgi:hypothetical protein